jgi:hypothetical protein
MAKGGTYEREIAKLLSRWWTDQKRDDIFWRTSNSGGRATVRARKGLTTGNHAPDLCAIDPIGQPFVDLIAVEIKRGYNKHTTHDLLDYPTARKGCKETEQVFSGFISQAYAAHETARSMSWVLIHRRDTRRPTIWLPRTLLESINHCGGNLGKGYFPQIRMKVACRQFSSIQVFGTSLDAFLQEVQPVHFRKMHRAWRSQL